MGKHTVVRKNHGIDVRIVPLEVKTDACAIAFPDLTFRLDPWFKRLNLKFHS